MNYAHVRNNQIIDITVLKYLDEDIQNIEVSDEIANACKQGKSRVIYQDGQVILNPNYEAEQLAKAKEAKYTEANDKAKEYLESGNALYELSKTQHIEATDTNIGKLGAKALGFVTGFYQPTDTIEWTTKEDELINLTQEQLAQVLQGLGVVQSEVWNKKYLDYVKQITDATTIENINNIVVDYTNEETTNG